MWTFDPHSGTPEYQHNPEYFDRGLIEEDCSLKLAKSNLEMIPGKIITSSASSIMPPILINLILLLPTNPPVYPPFEVVGHSVEIALVVIHPQCGRPIAD